MSNPIKGQACDECSFVGEQTGSPKSVISTMIQVNSSLFGDVEHICFQFP